MTVTRREFVRFDVAGDLAHFRRPYAITTALTFPIPPRTALCGLVGALLGLPKNESLRSLNDADAVFGLQMLGQLRTGHVSLNLLDTKGSPYFRPKTENPHTIMRYEVVREPRYRIWFSHAQLSSQLHQLLLEQTVHFTPCLGLAWMICWMAGEPSLVEAEKRDAEASTLPVATLARADTIVGDIEWEEQSIYQRIRMPAEMLPDRRVTRYQEYIIETTGGSVRARLSTRWQFSDGTAISAM